MSANKRGSASTESAQNGKLKIELEFEDAVRAALETIPKTKPTPKRKPRKKPG